MFIFLFPHNLFFGARDTVEPLNVDTFGTNPKCPDYRGVLIWGVTVETYKLHLGSWTPWCWDMKAWKRLVIPAVHPCHSIILDSNIKVYRIAGIFRGYKCSRFSRIKPVPRKFITMNLIACMQDVERLLFRENLSNCHSAKVYTLEIYPLYGIPDTL